jgi:signal transduction histidine kinase
MSALSLIVYDAGIVEERRGTLFPLPVEFFTLQQKSFYSVMKSGWSHCPMGYPTLAKFDALGRKVVLPGLRISGDNRKKKKLVGLPPEMSRETAEGYLEKYLETANSIRKERDTELANLTHDLRAISKEIYHAVSSARESLPPQSDPELVFHLDNAVNTQQLMSLRLDVIDYTTGASSRWTNEKISPYKKADKVRKSFRGFAVSKGCRIDLEGRAWGFIFGPPIFEMVPIVLIENAIKYSPPKSPIFVRFEENENEIIMRVESLGPQIKDDEKESIFRKNFRGEKAEQHSSTGSGIGLYAARTIMQTHFGGDVKVNQISNDLVGGQSYWKTRFTVIMKRTAEDDSDFIRSGRKR